MGGISGQNPMVFGKSKSQVQMIPVIGVTFDANLELIVVARGVILDGSLGIEKVRPKIYDVILVFKYIQIIVYLLIRPRTM